MPSLPEELQAWLLAHAGLAALGFSRALGLAVTAPALTTAGLDPRFRFLLAAMLGLLLWPVIEASGLKEPIITGPALGAACLIEAIVGAALGWSAALIVAGARQAGEIVASQTSFSSAALLDPEAGDELTALGHLYALIALGVFLALDGPVALVRSLAESYRVIPPGGGSLTVETAEIAFKQVGLALELAIKGAAPVAVAMTLAGVALGLLGRAAPSLQLLAAAMPVRALVGLLLVFLGLVTFGITLTSAWTAWAGV